MKLPSRYWQDLTTTDFESLDPNRTVAVLAAGAVEQHGPHLPLIVDARIGQHVLDSALDRLPENTPVLALPMLTVGVSPEHAAFAGTLSLSAETMLRAVEELGASVARAGVRKLVLVNSHGGQPQVMGIAAQKLRERNLLVVPVNLYRLWRAEAFFAKDEIDNGIHGGAIETSIMLHIAPDTVRREAIAAFSSRAPTLTAGRPGLARLRGVPFAWLAQDLNPDGAVGDATAADAGIGRELVEQATSALTEILQDAVEMPLLDGGE